jgi:chaperonin GroEL
MLKNVAKISANGDAELSDAVMECFDLVGDEGNVTIAEVSGPSHYEVEKVEGYPVTVGYEDSCGKFYPKFINDQQTQRTVLEKPIFLLYHGKITEFQSIVKVLDLVHQNWQANGTPHNVVLVATGFSEQVLSFLAFNFPEATSLNVYPLLVPAFPFANGQLYFLQDLAAITGSKVLDSLSANLEHALPEDLGPGVMSFEATRFRSNIVGKSSSEEGRRIQEDLILLRVDELQAQLSAAESQLEHMYLEERIGKLTGGIARLKVIGASNGELKEKRDRAEDAVCGVRGAIKHGSLPGGGWTLLRIMNELHKQSDLIIDEVLIPALYEPVVTLFTNAGVNEEETAGILKPILERIASGGTPLVYDLLEGIHVDPIEGGVLDSTPAVLEAIRNSISIATLLGTLGGAVVFKRDLALERSEASDTADWTRNATVNEADERP